MATDRPPAGGKCFEVTWFIIGLSGGIEDEAEMLGVPVSTLLNKGSPWRAVHGLPMGTSGPLKDRRHWHAWLERTTDESILVIDASNVHRGAPAIQIERDLYYAIGRLDDEHLWRFTPNQARRAYRRFGHCGPWIQGWQHMGEEDIEWPI